MMPAWAQKGLFTSSPAYLNSDLAIKAVKSFRAANISVTGLVLPINYENSYFSDERSILVDTIRSSFSEPSDLQLVLPFTNFVPKTSSLKWVEKFNNGYDTNKTFAV
jgi:hypothetical protein